jgi:protoporphyrinogen oxidase
MKGIILGAGFTGLAAGIKTGFPVYEASDHAGGICGSYWKGGYEFSVGGPHWLFGKGPGLDYIKSLVEVNEYERKAGVYYNHIFPFPIQETAQKKVSPHYGSMRHYFFDKFGQEQFNLFFDPFHERYTCGLQDDIIHEDAYKSPKVGEKTHIETFCDPVRGLGHLINVMSSKVDLRLNKRAMWIDWQEKKVCFEDGGVIDYDVLISTIPLDKCLELCGKKPQDLIYTSVHVLNIGADKTERTPEEYWIYTPFSRFGFHRLGFASNVDPRKAPKGKLSMSVEIALRHNERIARFANEQLIIKELQEYGFIGDVHVVDPTFVSTAYTWLKDPADRTNALNWLYGKDIISTGRYGKWKFQGMVQSIEDGLALRP